MMVQAVPRLVSARGKQRLSILIYHRVHPEPDYMRPSDPTVEQFDWQMKLLRQHFQPMALTDALRHLDSGTLPERAVCVTFDDGYADNATLALPVLQKWKVPATVFVSSDYLDGGIMWNDRVIEMLKQRKSSDIDAGCVGLGKLSLTTLELRKEAAKSILSAIKHWDPAERESAVSALTAPALSTPASLMMTSEQLRLLRSAGIEIGGHTASHPILCSLGPDAAEREIVGGKESLEEILDKPVSLFAYPNGRAGVDFTHEHAELVRKAGFVAAVTTHKGVSDATTNRWQMPRYTPWERTPGKFLLKLLLNLGGTVEPYCPAT
jgi:peptidoglycan/xylan/chitin deacetylase (PgdA/CDA1 family)